MSVTVVYRSAADLNRAEYWYEEGPKLQIEVEKLRKVAEAGEKAIKTLDNTCYLFAKADDRAIHNEAVKMFWQALAELDREGER